MIGRIKGISCEEYLNNKELIIKSLDLTEYKNIYARHLSGGNKRKLAVAMTLLI